MNQYIERVVDLTEPTETQIFGMTVERARALLFQQPEALGAISGSFALGRLMKPPPSRSEVVSLV